MTPEELPNNIIHPTRLKAASHLLKFHRAGDDGRSKDRHYV
jgi:hypothetical protein